VYSIIVISQRNRNL